QGELERMAQEEGRAAILLCDRGAMDGLAHWPGSNRTFFEEMGTSREELFQRYSLVIHLRTPCLEPGYIPLNQCRLEHPEAAIAIDHRIEKAWAGHPHRVVVGGASHFPEKVRQVVELVGNALPACCRATPVLV
ncbi:MAG: AAA family ATPase, partial [Holophagaceae bacterium]|nr:AAA family ATPase [Holophagaceae bacterium]